MPDNAELVISCKSPGTAEVNRFTDAVRNADHASAELTKRLGMMFSGGAILRFGTQAVRSFQATQDAAWKFSQTFKDVAVQANEAADVFQRVYNLSELSAKRMMGNTGDLLIGLGFDPAFALKMADAASRLGTDLAGYTNYAGQAEGATGALVSAMTGENERAKALGVVIRQDTEQWRTLTKAFKGAGLSMEQMDKIFGKFETTDKNVQAQWEHLMGVIKTGKGLTIQQANAMAAFSMAVAQSKNAIGDYIKDGESFSQSIMNQGQAASAFSAEVGEMIYKTLSLNKNLNAITGGFQSATKWLQELSPSGRRAASVFGVVMSALVTLKGVTAGYNLLRGVGAAMSAKNAEAARSEALAHQVNAAAIQKEEAAKASGAAGNAYQMKLADNAAQIASANQKVAEAQANLESAQSAYQAELADNQRTVSANRNAAMRAALSARQVMLDKQEEASAQSKALAVAQSELKVLAAQNERARYQMTLAGEKAVDLPEYTAAVQSVNQLNEAYRKTQEEIGRSAAEYERLKTAAVNANVEAEASTKGVEAAERNLQKAIQERQALQDQRLELISEDTIPGELDKWTAGNAALADAVKARNAALSQGKDALAAEAAATEAYNGRMETAAANAAMQAEAENAKNAALSRGATVTQANAVKTAVLAKQQKIAALQSTALGRAQIVLATGAKAAAVGFRTATVAAIGLMKALLPMLAISAVVAGIDYLLNRSKEAAKAGKEIADAEQSKANSILANHDKERAADQDKLRRYQELASYTNRTKEEQQELINLAGNLNASYGDLNVPLLKQNETLKDTAGLWDKIKKKQREAREEELKNALQASKRALTASALDLNKNTLNGWKEQAKAYWAGVKTIRPWESPISNAKKLIGLENPATGLQMQFEAIRALPYQQRMKNLERMLKEAEKRNDNEVYKALSAYIEKEKAARRAMKDYTSFRAGGGSETGDAGGNPDQKRMADNEKIRKLLDANNEKLKADDLEKYSRLRSIYQLESDQVKQRELMAKLDKEELAALDKEIQTKKNLWDQQKRSTDQKVREQSFKTNEELIKLEEKKYEIEQNALRRKLEMERQNEQADRNFYNGLSKSGMALRETASSAITADSEQAMRLQSRTFSSEVDFAKQNAENTKRTNDILKEIQAKEEKRNQEIRELRETVSKAFKTSSPG